MDSKDIFKLRLKSAREMNGLSMAALAAKMNGIVSPQAIYKYEAGKMWPDSTVLNALCDVLGVEPDYFYTPVTVSLEGISFRKKAKMTEREKKMIIGKIKDGIERYYEIEDICGIERKFTMNFHDTVVSSEEQVYELAARLRDEWELGKCGINNVIGLLENHNILVVETDASEDFDGLSGSADGSPVIVLNKNFSPERKRFTALHELGHILMKFSEDLTPKKIESLCHLFANEVLIPRESFREAVGDISSKPIHVDQFVNLQMLYGVSIDALMYKAMKLEMVPESRYVRFRKRKNSDSHFRQVIEQTRIKPESSDRFESLVYKAYAGELISLSKAATLLQIPECSVKQIYV